MVPCPHAPLPQSRLVPGLYTPPRALGAGHPLPFPCHGAGLPTLTVLLPRERCRTDCWRVLEKVGGWATGPLGSSVPSKWVQGSCASRKRVLMSSPGGACSPGSSRSRRRPRRPSSARNSKCSCSNVCSACANLRTRCRAHSSFSSAAPRNATSSCRSSASSAAPACASPSKLSPGMVAVQAMWQGLLSCPLPFIEAQAPPRLEAGPLPACGLFWSQQLGVPCRGAEPGTTLGSASGCRTRWLSKGSPASGTPPPLEVARARYQPGGCGTK